jgi:diguanylate cyclase (GGDEF)-like protein
MQAASGLTPQWRSRTGPPWAIALAQEIHVPTTRKGPLPVLTEAAAAVARSTDLDTAVERLLELALDSLGAAAVAAYLQDPDRVELQPGVVVGRDDRLKATLPGLLGDEDGPIVETSRDRTVRDIAQEALPDALASAGAVAAAVRPLTVRRGGIDISVGVLVLVWVEPRSSSADDASMIAALADLIAVAVDRGRLASMILERSEWFERMAHTDPLTGLANERTFGRVLELELARAARQGSEISLAIFDVDGLTATNNLYGHAVGDDVLRAVAAVLAESVRLVDTVARSGGDEFVLIAPGAAGASVAQRVLDGVLAVPPIDGATLSVSVGVARFPVDGTTGTELLAAADAALRHAQTAGPGQLAAAVGETRAPINPEG